MCRLKAYSPAAVTLPWLALGGKATRASLIFTTPAGGAINRNTYNARWREALDAAGLPRDRSNGFHALRHTFASVLLADGVDVRALSDYLGRAGQSPRALS